MQCEIIEHQENSSDNPHIVFPRLDPGLLFLNYLGAWVTIRASVIVATLSNREYTGTYECRTIQLTYNKVAPLPLNLHQKSILQVHYLYNTSTSQIDKLPYSEQLW